MEESPINLELLLIISEILLILCYNHYETCLCSKIWLAELHFNCDYITNIAFFKISEPGFKQ